MEETDSEGKIIALYGLPGAFHDYDSMRYEPADGLVVLYRLRVPDAAFVRDGEFWEAGWRAGPTCARFLLCLANKGDLDIVRIEGPAYLASPIDVGGTGPYRPTPAVVPARRKTSERAGQLTLF